jgi:hypothetical protein
VSYPCQCHTCILERRANKAEDDRDGLISSLAAALNCTPTREDVLSTASFWLKRAIQNADKHADVVNRADCYRRGIRNLRWRLDKAEKARDERKEAAHGNTVNLATAPTEELATLKAKLAEVEGQSAAMLLWFGRDGDLYHGPECSEKRWGKMTCYCDQDRKALLSGTTVGRALLERHEKELATLKAKLAEVEGQAANMREALDACCSDGRCLGAGRGDCACCTVAMARKSDAGRQLLDDLSATTADLVQVEAKLAKVEGLLPRCAGKWVSGSGGHRVYDPCCSKPGVWDVGSYGCVCDEHKEKGDEGDAWQWWAERDRLEERLRQTQVKISEVEAALANKTKFCGMVEAERFVLVKTLRTVDAEAAAMRGVIEGLHVALDVVRSDYSGSPLCSRVKVALSPDAGRTLLARLEKAEAIADTLVRSFDATMNALHDEVECVEKECVEDTARRLATTKREIEAQAAAMRRALETMVSRPHSTECACDACLCARAALAPDAGRELLTELAELREVAEAARDMIEENCLDRSGDDRDVQLVAAVAGLDAAMGVKPPTPVAKCEVRRCRQPVTHAEHWYDHIRYWCDEHVPMSGHYEHCPNPCEKLVANIGRTRPADAAIEHAIAEVMRKAEANARALFNHRPLPYPLVDGKEKL